MGKPNRAKPNQLRRAYAARGGLCFYCDGVTWLPSAEDKVSARLRLGIMPEAKLSGSLLRAALATREHLTRVTEGGTNIASNIVLACNYCNTTRHDADPGHHRSIMRELVAAGLHPTNRANARYHPSAYRNSLKVIDRIRRGLQPQPQPQPQENVDG